MAKKKGKSQSSTPKDEGPYLVESDRPNGPWTRVPDSAVTKKVLSPDTDEMAEARLQIRTLNWLVPVDLMTELYDSMLGCNTRLWSQQLEVLRRKFGPAFTLDDIRLWLFACGQKMDGLGWPIIVKLVETEPPAKDSGGGDTPMTLREFFKEHCEQLTDSVRESRVLALQGLNQKHKLKPPLKPIRHEGGKSDLFLPNFLKENWAAYRLQLRTLPPLRQF